MLLFSAIIWGLSFTCIKWALVDFSTTQLLFWRLLSAFILGEISLYIFNKDAWQASHSDIFLTMKPGLFLGLSLLFQIHGLHYTTATNSAFITSLYVILIPFIAILFLKHSYKIMNFIFAILAFLGMALLLDLPNKILNSQDFNFNVGDLLSLGCAVSAAFQITYIGLTVKKSKNAFRYNTYQTFWCLLVVIPFFIYESFQKNISIWPSTVQPLSYLGLGLLIVFVSIIAFYFQVRAQKKLSTATASMICLLEAPFSFLFAAILISESLVAVQIFGGLLMLLSSAFSVYIDRPRR